MYKKSSLINSIVAPVAMLAALGSMPVSAKVLLLDNFDNGDPYKPDVVCDMPNKTGATPTTDNYWMPVMATPDTNVVISEDAATGLLSVTGVDKNVSGITLKAVYTYNDPTVSSVVVNSGDPCLSFFPTAAEPNPKRVLTVSGISIEGASLNKAFHAFKLIYAASASQSLFGVSRLEIVLFGDGTFSVRSAQPASLSWATSQGRYFLKAQGLDNFLLVPPYFRLPAVPSDVKLTLDKTNYEVSFDFSVGLVPGLSAVTVANKVNSTLSDTFHTMTGGNYTFRGEHGLNEGYWKLFTSETNTTNTGGGGAIVIGAQATAPGVTASDPTLSHVTTVKIDRIEVTDGNP